MPPILSVKRQSALTKGPSTYVGQMGLLYVKTGRPPIRHARGSRKWIPGSDPVDLDPGSAWIIDPHITVFGRSTEIIDSPSE